MARNPVLKDALASGGNTVAFIQLPLVSERGIDRALKNLTPQQVLAKV